MYDVKIAARSENRIPKQAIQVIPIEEIYKSADRARGTQKRRSGVSKPLLCTGTQLQPRTLEQWSSGSERF